MSDRGELLRILTEGALYPVSRGYGEERDLDRCEGRSLLPSADPAQVSDRAIKRGFGQVGSLGSGNHFHEVQVVDEVPDAAVAEVFGLHAGQVCVMIHCGSRGLGQQVCQEGSRCCDG